MGPSVDAKLDKPSTTVGLNDPAQSAEDSVDAAIVQTLMALNPVAGLTLVAFNNITKSDPVSNPVFRSGTDDNGLFGLGNFSLVEDRLANASQAKAAGNDAEFKKFSEQALNEARLLPNGDSLAVPMVEADLLALDGKFEEASKKYKAVEASLKAIPSCNGELSDAIEGVKKRHRGVLAAGVATGALTFAKAQKEGDGTAMLDAQRLATSCADELYLMNPSEKTLQMLVAAYKQVGLDLRGIRTQIGQNKAKIAEEFNKLTGFIPTGPVVEPINPNKVLEKFGFASPNFPALDVDMPSPEPVDPIKQLEKLNEVGQDLINRTEAHFLELIAQAHPNDTYQQHIEAATAFAIGGNHHKALEELQDARRQFKFGPVVVPSTPENMAKEITVLHRIVGVSGISYDLHDEVLKESRELIKELKKESPDQAALFTVENMELQASLNSDRGALHIGSPNNSDDENEAAANRYHAGVRKGQMDIVDFCEKALKDVKDPGTREALGARMFQARAAVLELDLGEALVEHEKDEKDVAERISANALKQFNDFAAKHKDVPNAAGYAEGMGRARLAEGYYQFRTGKIEESIATLKAIKKDYPESTASLKISGRGFWPNEAGIVDGDGNITDTDKEDVMAAITTAASKLNKEKGRGLAACGIGAGLFIAADLALGEKVSGVAVASACVAGYVVDRALLIAESSNEIAASYRTGVSTATVGDALLATGEFVLNIACMYMGGAAGGLAEKVVLNYGSRLGGELTGFLLSAGLKPGPWTRAAGEFALTESAYVANAVAFHKTSGFLNQTGTALMHGQMPSYKDTDTAEDYFVSWLFVRVMPMAMEANPGGKVIRNETAFDRSVQKAVNMGYGGVVIQELRAIFTKDPSQVSLNALGNTAWDLFFIHHGNHALESAIPMKSVAKFSRTLDLQTRNNLESIRKAVDEAPSAGSWWDQSFGWIKTGGTPPEPIKTDDSGVTNDPPPLLARENPVTDPTDMTPPYLHNKLKFTTDFKFPSDPVLIVDPKSVPTQQTPVDPKAIATEPGAPKGDATLEVAVNGKSAAKDLSPEAKAEQDRLERIFSEAIEATKNGKLLGPEQQKAMAKLTSLQLINAKNMNAALENPFHVSAMETLANAGGELGRMAREFGDLAKSTRKKIGEYEKKVDAYHRSGEAKDLLEAENYFDKELDKDLAKLRSSDYFKLNEAFDQNVALAEAAIEPLTFDLASREIQAGKEKPIGFRVHVKSLDELNLDANDPAGSLAKLDPKELITVEVRTTDEAQKNEIEKAIKDKGWEDLPVTVTSAEAPAKTQPSATSSFAVAGPAMGAMGLFEQLSSWGLSPLGAGLLTGVAVLGSTVAMGMAFNGRFNRAPEPLEMKQGGLPKTLGPSHDVVVKYRPDAPGGGSFVLINGPENNGRKSSTPVFVNGRDVSGKKFQVLGPTAEITIGDRTYSFKDMTPPSAKSSEYVTERPYFGERATGIFRVSGSNTAKNDAAFRTVQTGDSGTVTFLVQGKGKTAAQLGAVSEVDTAIGNSVEAGMKVEDIVNGARPQAQMFVAIPTLMPKIDVMAVELKPNADDATKFDPRFIASGPDTSKMNDTGLEAWVFHPSNTNEAIFKASGYVSSPDKPLDTGDVIICGRLSEMFSEKFLGDVVGRLSQGGRVPTNVEIQGALIQEARVRSKMLENAGGKDVVLTQAAYNKAFTDLYGNGTPLTYKGLYSGDANALSGTIEYYTLKSDGSVVDYRGKTVDHFKAESEGIGFMVQVVGSK